MVDGQILSTTAPKSVMIYVDMCNIQYKGQLSKEQVRELVKKYPLENPATQKDLQHLADALDRNGTCPLARAINALTDKVGLGLCC